MKFASRAGALLFGGMFLAACGRYAPPVSPELTSPQSVEVVEVAKVTGAANSGLAIKWLAPERDVRGEPLKELWGYQVYRLVGELRSGENVGIRLGADGASRSASDISGMSNTVPAKAGPANSGPSKAGSVMFEKIGEVNDSTVAKLRELQQKAREQGQVERKVKLAREDRLVSFVDRSFKAGVSQSYKIVPINSSFVMPEVDKILQVKTGIGAELQFEMVSNPEFTEVQELGGAGFEDDMVGE